MKSSAGKYLYDQTFTTQTTGEFEDQKGKLQIQIKECKDTIFQKKLDIENGEKGIKAIQEPLVKILNIFKDSPLQILVAEKIAGTEDSMVNAQTIKQ